MTLLRKVVIGTGLFIVLCDVCLNIYSIRLNWPTKPVEILDEMEFVSTISRLDEKSIQHLSNDELDKLHIYVDDFTDVFKARKYKVQIEHAFELIGAEYERREAAEKQEIGTIITLT